MSPNPYAENSIEELEALEQKLASERDELSVHHKAVRQALDGKRAQAEAAAKLAAMPDAERAAITQLLQAGSVESAEQFGKIGG